jgi:hypothetical protein
MKAAGPSRRERCDIHARSRAFLEFQRMARTDQSRGQRADARLVPHQRYAAPAGLFPQLLDNSRVGPAGRERLGYDNGGVRVEATGNDLGRLFGANERTRQHDIEVHPNTHEAGSDLPKPSNTLVRQGPLGIIRPRFAAFSRNSVANEVELRRHLYRADARGACVPGPVLPRGNPSAFDPWGRLSAR